VSSLTAFTTIARKYGMPDTCVAISGVKSAQGRDRSMAGAASAACIGGAASREQPPSPKAAAPKVSDPSANAPALAAPMKPGKSFRRILRAPSFFGEGANKLRSKARVQRLSVIAHDLFPKRDGFSSVFADMKVNVKAAPRVSGSLPTTAWRPNSQSLEAAL
jgi:hypothetical protein